MSRPGHSPVPPSLSTSKKPDEESGASTAPTTTYTDLTPVDPVSSSGGRSTPSAVPPPGTAPKGELSCPTHGTPLRRARNELQAILNELKFVTRKIRDDDVGTDEMNDWKFAAMVIDRLCFWIFTIYLVVATLAIFFSSPNLRTVISGSS